MFLLNLTLDAPAANLALDEALLETAELVWAGQEPNADSIGDVQRMGQTDFLSKSSECQHREILRLWEPAQRFVVLGRSSLIHQEVNLEACRQLGVPVLRRCSGGATIVTGPGCLMYAVVLSYAEKPELRKLDKAHQFVLGQVKLAIQRLGIDVSIQGTSDLTLQNRKFSGNSLRCRRHGFLYHGTLLSDFDLSLVAKCLGSPLRQPTYRASRSHDDFLTRLPVSTKELSHALIEQWKAEISGSEWPREMTEQLVTEKYQTREWTEQR
jgi:lipoate-protein ligase A